MTKLSTVIRPGGGAPSALLPWFAVAGAVVVLGVAAADVWQRYARWTGRDGTAPPAAAVTPPAAGQPGSAPRVQEIVSAHLFGAPAAPRQTQVTAAPTTRLRLTLYGVVASDDPKHARALVGHSSAPARSYRIGEQIDGTDAKLHAVEQARVLLDRGGQMESLALPKPELSSRAGPPAPPLPTAEAAPTAPPNPRQTAVAQEQASAQQSAVLPPIAAGPSEQEQQTPAAPAD